MTRRVLALRAALLVAPLLFLRPLHLSAQSSVAYVEPNGVLSPEPEQQVELGWTAPIRFEPGAVRENGTRPFALLMVRSSEAVTGATPRRPTTIASGWLVRVAGREVPRLKLSAAFANSAFLVVQQPAPRKRSWIARHPVLFGTLVGFGGGFLIGYLPGDDGVFDDFTAEFNGWVLGGVGAGTGAMVGAVVGAATK